MTIDLDSITDADYLMKFTDTFGSAKALKKTTTDGNVTWQLTDGFGYYVYSDIYYDSSRSQNVIQMYIEVELLRLTSADWATFNHRILIDYVGDWPDLIGKANSYWTYEFQEETQQSSSADLSQIRFGNTIASEPGSLDRSPKMRIDDAYYRAFEYPIIGDRVYDPAAIKTNPATTINNPTQYGTSITFGGNTYNVSKDGKINLNGHNIQVKDIVFLSIPNPEGGYDNMMGNTLISNSAQPSTITFNGKWSASITTTEQESYTYTVTEWKAGDFAWDGMDHNFIMAGLLASLGAFVGVGIYARRTKATVWPLLIVCGGAALLFFVML
jgi:surface antigen